MIPKPVVRTGAANVAARATPRNRRRSGSKAGRLFQIAATTNDARDHIAIATAPACSQLTQKLGKRLETKVGLIAIPRVSQAIATASRTSTQFRTAAVGLAAFQRRN